MPAHRIDPDDRPGVRNPAATDHPTGDEQAAENDEKELAD
jgi:hypothetical protein